MAWLISLIVLLSLVFILKSVIMRRANIEKSGTEKASTSSTLATNSVGSTQNQKNKTKVIFVMGATATGKSKLSVDLATYFSGEIINSDKIQVYEGLDIITNKITEAEGRSIPHHMIGFVDPNEDFTVDDFCHHALQNIDIVSKKGRLPIIAGGSNSYLETLVEDSKFKFQDNFECCFIWLDVSKSVLYKRVANRVDEMVEAGLVEEVRGTFVPEADYTKGIRRAIGAPEMHDYFMLEKDTNIDDSTKNEKLAHAIEEIKVNTCKLVDSQFQKIQRLREELGWKMHRIDATSVHEKCGKDAEDEWMKEVLEKTITIVDEFLK
ncbi:adenylate isopentenyltransferase 5, chloroplastic-like [Herrania umbratica]|uniref:adenylate dimethylallyltransferase (ADP/ATP-dependent) n=1 Tax=Herrania umbratica TaxID=108875 RepID=A0A6J1B313_9ROSI|nr:adenylate isopentenyltransferase 5, chloroplastic-like [Herrania umbratica]